MDIGLAQPRQRSLQGTVEGMMQQGFFQFFERIELAGASLG